MSVAGAIEAFELAVGYDLDRHRRRLTALRDISLSIEPGEFVALVGPSGCGKTTFIRAIAGIVQPSAGRLLVGGKPPRRPGPDRAMVFQDYALMPWRTVEANVRFPFELTSHGLSAEEVTARVEHVIGLVQLTGFERSYPHELSGGMRQRVGIARALVVEPAVLLMDEPFGALDALTREAMQADLEQIVARTKQTVVFITHSIDEAIMLADRVVVVTHRPGRIREIVKVDLPRPRFDPESDTKSNPTYALLRDHVWNLVMGEALGARPA